MNNQKGVQKAKRIFKWVALFGMGLFAATVIMDKIPGIFEVVHPMVILTAGAFGSTIASIGSMAWLILKWSFKQSKGAVA